MQDEAILIVENNPYELESAIILAKKAGLSSFGVANTEAAIQLLEGRRFDILLTDIFLSENTNGLEGLTFIDDALAIQPNILPMVMSSHPDERIYQKAMNQGALFALKKPLVNADEIMIAIRASKEKRALKNLKGKGKLKLADHLKTLCPDGLYLPSTVLKWVTVGVQHPHLPIVIYGETGTGKEEVAKMILRRREEKEGALPFLSVNCALLDGDLASSLLFGHKKGAFSGAYSTTQGFIGEAHGGILFLDEIHALSLSCQQKLLRVLNDGKYSRVGETKELYSKFQVIVASSRDLDDAVDDGRFLLDLRVRLTGIDIPLLPLRERKADLPILIELFFARQAIEISIKELEKLNRLCSEFYWQGNIRQLYQCLKALLALSLADGLAPLAENLPILKTMQAPK